MPNTVNPGSCFPENKFNLHLEVLKKYPCFYVRPKKKKQFFIIVALSIRIRNYLALSSMDNLSPYVLNKINIFWKNECSFHV